MSLRLTLEMRSRQDSTISLRLLLFFGTICSYCVSNTAGASVTAVDAPMNPNAEFRIVNGFAVHQNTAPWFAQVIAINQEQSSGVTFASKCGGSLIKPFIVMTAAHCLRDSNNKRSYMKVNPVANYSKPAPGNILITLGRILNLKSNEPIASIDHHVVSFVCHPEFHSDQAYTNDICLLKLNSPSTKACVALNSGGNSRNSEVPGTPIFAFGFGDTQPVPIHSNRIEEVVPSQRLLRSKEMAIVEPARCAAAINRLLAPSNGELPVAAFGTQLLCTDTSVSDACHGDSGGPLLYANTSMQVWQAHAVWTNVFSHSHGIRPLVGIISYGYGCRTGIPALNTRVSHYAAWIDEASAEMNNH